MDDSTSTQASPSITSNALVAGRPEVERIYSLTASRDIETVKKATLLKDRSRTHNQQPARVAQLSTCDRSLPLRNNGDSDYSYYMLFDRVE